MVTVLFLIIAFVAFSVFYLRGDNLRYLDAPLPPPDAPPPSDAHREVVRTMNELTADIERYRGRERLGAIRRMMDELGEGKALESRIEPVQSDAIRGEWVLAPGADSRRRVLYLHGGAWFAGSPTSHRPITDRLSRLLGAAVFAVDYRLCPEYRRIDGIDDCREALRWILHNGPEDSEPPAFLLVAGDSAGGNLTLEVIAWARDAGLRLPDAAIALSPATDVTMTSPSLRANEATDPMLGPAFGKLLRLPTILLWWFYWISWRIPPKDPRVSPLRGNLRDLPPVLIQASRAEMLLDDARRYAARAQASGSPVTLQTWPHMVHVWQLFTPELPEAEEAYAAMADFVATVEAGRAGAGEGASGEPARGEPVPA
jgi:epsilon-lactone hydrolase